MFVHVGLHRHALHKYALSKNLLLLQSLIYVLLYQENKATIAEIGQSFLEIGQGLLPGCQAMT